MSLHIKTLCSFLVLALIISCQSGPSPLRYETDTCDFCKMKLMDRKFGAELITPKGRMYKFDDIGCMLRYESEKKGGDQGEREFVVNYSGKDMLLGASTAIYRRGPGAASPMGSNLAAFSNAEDEKKFAFQIGGEKLTWKEVRGIYIK